MKKLIAILAIMVVLAGAVFAAETHTIRIMADVTEVIPIFGLKMTTPAQSYVTNDAAAFGAGSSYGHTANNQAFDVVFNLDEDGSVVFTALLMNPAKQNETYTLEFGGGTFAVKKNGGNASLAPTSITTSAGTTTAGLTIAAGSNATVSGATNKIINLTFDGTTVAAAASDPYPLATATYEYTADPEIDPTEEGQYYYADVTLVVTAT